MQPADGQIGDLMDILAGYRHCQGFPLQALPLAGLAGRDTHKGFIFLLHGVGAGLPVTPLHILYQPLKGHVIDAFSPLPLIVDLHFLAARAMEQNLLHLLRQFLERRVQTELILLRQGSQDGVGKAPLVRTGLPARHLDCPIRNA